MDKKLSVLNFTLIIAATGLLIWNARIWLNPKYPAQIDGSSLNMAPKSLQNYDVKRKTYPASIVSNIGSGNLFRKERQEFQKPSEPVQVVASTPKPQIPPPEFNVKGIMMLASSKIAILDGKYYVNSGETNISRKPIKKKGYRLGDYIGDFQVIDINQLSVTLSDGLGNSVTKKLNQKSTTPIKKQGNNLAYKPPKKAKNAPEVSRPMPPVPVNSPKPRPIPKTTPVRVQPKQNRPISHISGKAQFVAPPRGANVSGENISGRQTRVNRPRISGR